MNLANDRVYLREIKESDWKDIHTYASQEKVSQYQPWGPNTEKDTKTYIKQSINDASENPRSRFVFVIIDKKVQKLIGAGEFTITDFINKVGEIGYVVNPDYWGKGYGTEVAKLLIEFGFREFNFHRIFATCDPRNVGSAKVLEKIGMTKEGEIREHIMLKNGWRDSFLYSILEHEWKG